MLEFYDSQMWLSKYGKESWFCTFHHPSFLNVHAEIYNVKPVHFTFSYKENVVIAVSTFEKEGKLVTPDHFLRTGFWINNSFSDMQLLNLQQAMLTQLTTIYKSIVFHLPVEIIDIRVFTWSSFRFKLMHTYEKDLRIEEYHVNIQRMLKKGDPGFKFTSNEENFERILEVHRQDFRRFGIREKYIRNYIPLLQRLRDTGFLIDMNLKMGDEIVASNLVLLNREMRKAYIVRIARSEQWYQFGTHAKIYHESFKYLKKEGYKIADLFGADVPGFAFFKLKFSVKLKHHYMVFYNQRIKREQEVILGIKSFLKKYFFKY